MRSLSNAILPFFPGKAAFAVPENASSASTPATATDVNRLTCIRHPSRSGWDEPNPVGSPM